MNRLMKLKEAFVKSSWDDVFLRNRDLPEMTGDKVMDKPYEKSELVYVCISTTARAISQVPLQVMRKNSDGVWEPVESDDPWQLSLTRPNPRMDIYSFVESIVSYLMLDGNSYIIPIAAKGINSICRMKKTRN